MFEKRGSQLGTPPELIERVVIEGQLAIRLPRTRQLQFAEYAEFHRAFLVTRRCYCLIRAKQDGCQVAECLSAGFSSPSER
jgi:hypothetical protein